MIFTKDKILKYKDSFYKKMIYNVPKKRFLKVQKWMPSKEKVIQIYKRLPRLQKKKIAKILRESRRAISVKADCMAVLL